MAATIALAIFTKRSPDDEPRVILRREGEHDWSPACEPNPDVGRFRPTCVGRSLEGKSVVASLFALARDQLRWDFAGPDASYVRLADRDGLTPALWGMVLPFTYVLRFTTPISSASYELCTRAKVAGLVPVHASNIDTYDWCEARAMERGERLAVLKGFESLPGLTA